MVLITRFIFFLPLLLIWDVWVALSLALFGFARCFEAEGCRGKGRLQMGLDLSELFNSELLLEVKTKIRWSLLITIKILHSYSGVQVQFFF